MKTTKGTTLIGALVLITVMSLILIFNTILKIDNILTTSTKLDNELVSNTIVPSAITYLVLQVCIFTFIIFLCINFINKIYLHDKELKEEEQELDKKLKKLLNQFEEIRKEKNKKTDRPCNPKDLEGFPPIFDRVKEEEGIKLPKEEALAVIKAKQGDYPHISNVDFTTKFLDFTSTLSPIRSKELTKMKNIYMKDTKDNTKAITVLDFISSCMGDKIPAHIMNEYIIIFFKAEDLVNHLVVTNVHAN